MTRQIIPEIPPETGKRFIEELPRTKAVDVLFEKLDDFNTAIRGLKTTTLNKLQNSINREVKSNQMQKNAHRNNIKGGERVISSSIICYLCNFLDISPTNVQIQIK